MGQHKSRKKKMTTVFLHFDTFKPYSEWGKVLDLSANDGLTVDLKEI